MGVEKEAIAKACVDMEQRMVVNHYPKCPQPDLALGIMRHTDPGTITILILFQDQLGGLQVPRDGAKTWSLFNLLREEAFIVYLGDHWSCKFQI